MNILQMALSRSALDIELIQKLIDEQVISEHDIKGSENDFGALECLLRTLALRDENNSINLDDFNDQKIEGLMAKSALYFGNTEGVEIFDKERKFIFDLIHKYQVPVDRKFPGLSYSPLEFAVMMRDTFLCQQLLSSPQLKGQDLAERLVEKHNSKISWYKWLSQGKDTFDSIKSFGTKNSVLDAEDLSNVQRWDSMKVLLDSGALAFEWVEEEGGIAAYGLKKKLNRIKEMSYYDFVVFDKEKTPRQNLETLVVGLLCYGGKALTGSGTHKYEQQESMEFSINCCVDFMNRLGLRFDEIQVPLFASGKKAPVTVALPTYLAYHNSPSVVLLAHALKKNPALCQWKTKDQSNLSIDEKTLWKLNVAMGPHSPSGSFQDKLSLAANSVDEKPKNLCSAESMKEYLDILKVFSSKLSSSAMKPYFNSYFSMLVGQEVYAFSMGADNLLNEVTQVLNMNYFKTHEWKSETFSFTPSQKNLNEVLNQQTKDWSAEKKAELSSIIAFHLPFTKKDWAQKRLPGDLKFYQSRINEPVFQLAFNNMYANHTKMLTATGLSEQEVEDLKLMFKLNQQIKNPGPSAEPALGLKKPDFNRF